MRLRLPESVMALLQKRPHHAPSEILSANFQWTVRINVGWKLTELLNGAIIHETHYLGQPRLRKLSALPFQTVMTSFQHKDRALYLSTVPKGKNIGFRMLVVTAPLTFKDNPMQQGTHDLGRLRRRDDQVFHPVLPSVGSLPSFAWALDLLRVLSYFGEQERSASR